MPLSFQSAALASCLLLLPRSILSENDGVSQQHRSLESFTTPFQIRWRFNIAQGAGFPEPRQPTADEYDGILDANEEWFTIEIPFFYAGETEFTFQEIDCVISETTYTPGEDWDHNVVQLCEVEWDADSLASLPTAPDFLVDMNADYLLDNFVANHLRSADPQNPRSVFQSANRVGYVTTNTGSTSPSVPDDGSTPAPVGVVPTEMPVMAPTATTEAPAAAPTSTPLPERKDAPQAKCGSLAGANNRGGSAAQAKDCDSSRLGDGGRKRRKLKGSHY